MMWRYQKLITVFKSDKAHNRPEWEENNITLSNVLAGRTGCIVLLVTVGSNTGSVQK